MPAQTIEGSSFNMAGLAYTPYSGPPARAPSTELETLDALNAGIHTADQVAVDLQKKAAFDAGKLIIKSPLTGELERPIRIFLPSLAEYKMVGGWVVSTGLNGDSA